MRAWGLRIDRWPTRLTAALAGLLLLAGCADSGGIGGTGGGGPPPGRSMGEVTGFGSVIVNDTRQFDIVAGTEITLDEATIGEAALEAVGPGLVVVVDVDDDVNADVSAGTALAIAGENVAVGRVTATDPLEVLDQPVATTGDTVLVGVGAVAGLAVGDPVSVSGYGTADNVIQATRIQRHGSPRSTWRVIGRVSAVGGSTLDIGNLTVATGGVEFTDCNGGLATGDRVRVEAARQVGFSAGDTLTTARDIRCLAEGLGVAGGEGTVAAQIEGLVTSVSLPTFAISGQPVRLNAGTDYEGGGRPDLVLGAKVEAEGVLDLATGVLTADEVRFRDTRIRIEGPLAAGDVNVGVSLTMLGITALGLPLTEDDDSILASGTGGGDIQAELRGFVDGSDTAYITRIRDRGDPADPDDVRLRGPVTAIDAGSSTFQVLAVNVDVTNMDLQDAFGNSLTETQFFNILSVGDQVDVDKASYDSATGTISENVLDASVEIEF